MMEQEPEENEAERSENRAKTKYISLNWTYMPIKAHYFFLYGGMGGTVPYMQVLAKDFGINATVVGIIYTIIPLCVCLSKPMFGFITDKLQNIKAVLLVILLVTAVSFFAILFVPPINNISMEVKTECGDQITELIITPPIHKSFRTKESSNKHFACNFASSCFKNQTQDGILMISNHVVNNNVSDAFTFKFSSREIPKYNCDCIERSVSHVVCDTDFYDSVLLENSKSVSEYEKYNFWVFVLLSVISGTGSATTYCLSDAACYEVVRNKPQAYGRQRLWGTISWGLATLLTGYLNDIATGVSKTQNYYPGFYLMLAFVLVDTLILSRVQLKKANVSTNICKDVGTIFTSWKTAVFATGVYVSGAMCGLLWTYEFWYLTELGSSQLLLGLVAGVQCLVTEVPFFFFSGWFIKKFGHFYCMIASIAAFALRLWLYTILYNPWMVLPIEVLHGITYAVFCAAMTLYAVECAPPGTEATMLGILGGIFEGLGVGTGSFLGGIGFDIIGGRSTFFIASMISLCCVPVFTIAYKILSRSDGSLDLDSNKISRRDTPNCVNSNMRTLLQI